MGRDVEVKNGKNMVISFSQVISNGAPHNYWQGTIYFQGGGGKLIQRKGYHLLSPFHAFIENKKSCFFQLLDCPTYGKSQYWKNM